MQQHLPHNVLGKKIYEMVTHDGMANSLPPDVIIHAMLAALQNFAGNTNTENYAIGVMHGTAHTLAAIRDAKAEAPYATHH